MSNSEQSIAFENTSIIYLFCLQNLMIFICDLIQFGSLPYVCCLFYLSESSLQGALNMQSFLMDNYIYLSDYWLLIWQFISMRLESWVTYSITSYWVYWIIFYSNTWHIIPNIIHYYENDITRMKNRRYDLQCPLNIFGLNLF